MDDLCALASYSQWHFIRKFQEVTGKTPKQYLSAIRLEKAHQFLSETDAGISEIARACGFGSWKNFYYAFRKEFAIGPEEWKAAERRNKK